MFSIKLTQKDSNSEKARKSANKNNGEANGISQVTSCILGPRLMRLRVARRALVGEGPTKSSPEPALSSSLSELSSSLSEGTEIVLRRMTLPLPIAEAVLVLFFFLLASERAG